MGIQEAVRGLVRDCIEEGMSRQEMLSMMPSLIIATGQSDLSSGLLAEPIRSVVAMATAEFDRATTSQADSIDQAINLRLAQMYADAEDAITADGDVLDADEFDPEVDEVDTSEAAGAWADGGGQFKFVLEADE